MIYLMNEKEVGELEFRAALKEDISKIFGTDPSIIHNLANEALFNMSHQFKEVGIGDSRYQILYHPIKIVYVETPVYPASNKPLAPMPEKWTINDWPQPYKITSGPFTDCVIYTGRISDSTAGESINSSYDNTNNRQMTIEELIKEIEV